jgi:transglutaminase/protease-like cytokinesis protein 3
VARYRSQLYPTQRHRKKAPSNSKGNFLKGLLLLGLIGGGIWYLSPQDKSQGLPFADLFTIPANLQQAVNPKTLVITKRVDNPVPGNGKTFSVDAGERLDQLAGTIVYEGTSVKELANAIRPFANNDGEKARLAYSWITQNIAYDVPMAETRNIDDLRPETVLARGETICSGYANLYQALVKELGLDVVIIEGFAKGGDVIVGDDPDVNHAWNGVNIDGVWYLLDTTWGAGIVSDGRFEAKFNPNYFATPPEQLIVSHFPRETQWQLLAQPYDRQTFDQLPALTPRFFRDQMALVSHAKNDILTGGDLELDFRAGKDVQVMAQLVDKLGQPVDKQYTLSQSQGGRVKVNAAFPQPGDYKLLILSKNSQEETYYQAIAYDVQAQGSGEPFPSTYGTFSEKQVKLISPLRRSLPINQANYFQIQVPGAEQVVLVDEYRRQMIPLERTGDIFTGSEVLSFSNVTVAAQFPGSNQFWSLLEYD